MKTIRISYRPLPLRVIRFLEWNFPQTYKRWLILCHWSLISSCVQRCEVSTKILRYSGKRTGQWLVARNNYRTESYLKTRFVHLPFVRALFVSLDVYEDGVFRYKPENINIKIHQGYIMSVLSWKVDSLRVRCKSEEFLGVNVNVEHYYLPEIKLILPWYPRSGCH